MSFIQIQNDTRDDYKTKPKVVPLLTRFFQKKSTKGVLLLTVIAITLPVLCYYFIFDKGTFPAEIVDTCGISKTYRIPCGNDTSKTFDDCTKIHCCFDNSTKSCFHYLPSKYYYYYDSGDKIYQPQLEKTPFDKAATKSIQVTVVEVNENQLQVILHEDTKKEKPREVVNKNYKYTLHQNPFAVEIMRNDSTSDLLLTTAKGPLIISPQYWEWTFQLSEEFLFGLGQTLIDLDENSTLTKVIYGNGHDHTTLPIFIAYKNKQYHGLIIRHYGPLEITVLPSKLVILRSLGGKEIRLELSIGPSLKDVMQQQNPSNLDESNLDSFGLHLCREGDVTALKTIVDDFNGEMNKQKIYDIKYASDCLHENIILALQLENRPNTVNGLINSIKNISASSKFMMTLLPHVPVESDFYEKNLDLGLYYTYLEKVFWGQYSKINVSYPNFDHPKIEDFVKNLFDTVQEKLSDVLIQDVSGFLLTRNWPSDSYQMEPNDTFQYLSQALIDAMSLTIPWDLKSANEINLLNHMKYGEFQMNQVQKQKPSLTIMTSSHTIDTTNTILVQNVPISWTNFQKSIISILSHSVMGNQFISIPVCGTEGTIEESYESLCLQWYQMASVSPVFRISSDLPRRDPNSLADVSQFLANYAKAAIDFRDQLKHYFLTTLSKNEPLMRPMFYDFPNDIETFPLVEQYMVGSSILVAHPTLVDQAQIKVYLPEGIWFEFLNGYAFGKNQSWISLDLVESDWIRFIREGSIIPLVQPVVEEEESKGDFILKVALKCETECVATGDLKMGSVVFESNANNLTLKIENVDEVTDLFLIEVIIFQEDKTRFLKLEKGISLADITICTYGESEITC